MTTKPLKPLTLTEMKRANLMVRLSRHQIQKEGDFDPQNITKIVDKIIPKDKPE
jgi:hypothetical protein